MSDQPRPRRSWRRALAVAALLLLAFVVIVPRLIDAQRFLPQIERVLEEATGWEADLGEIEFSLLRGALSVSPARLAAPGGDSSSVEIGRIDIDVQLLPLLRKQLRIDRIRLVRPQIRLLRSDEETGWIVPWTEAPASAGEQTDERPVRAQLAGFPGTSEPVEPDGDAENGFELLIDEIEVTDGSLQLDDLAVTPPLTLELGGVSARFHPSDGRTDGRLTFGDDEGRARWKGRVGDSIDVTLEKLHTELLQKVLGPDLIQAGGELSGEVAIAFPLRVEGKLTADRLTLLSGTRPFDAASLEFVVAPLGLGWQLERLEFHADEAIVTGQGSLAPTLALELELPETDLDVAVRASDSILPLPIEVRGPGNIAATIRVYQPAGGDLTYEADGRLAAAALLPGELLPAVTDVEATFKLDRNGRLEVQLARGSIAGGPVSGSATIDSLDPPGKLRFSGGLSNAVFGQLLGGLVREAEPVTGPTGFRAELGVDLAREILDARSLSGRIDFEARELAMPGWDLDHALRSKIDEKMKSGSAGLLRALVDKNGGDTENAQDAGRDALERLIDGLTGSIDFDRWPWGLERITLTVGDLTALGEGSFDPETGAVQFALMSSLDREASQRLVAKHSALKVLVARDGKLTVPLSIDGTLFAPSIHVDLDRALKNNLLGSDKDEVKSLLKGLLDRREARRKKKKQD